MTKRQRNTVKVIPFLVLLALLVLWFLVSYHELIPSFMLPSPQAILKAFWTDRVLLLNHLEVTMLEALVGLSIGVLLGSIYALTMDRSRLVKEVPYPLLVLTQTIPTVAIAPLLVLWLDYGLLPEITLVVIVTFFPIAMNLYQGFQGADKDSLFLLQAMGAYRLDLFRHVKWPVSLTSFFAGLKISTPCALVGAVITEWLGGYAGLRVYMTKVKKSYSLDKMFAVTVFISITSYLCLLLVQWLERKSMSWKKGEKHGL